MADAVHEVLVDDVAYRLLLNGARDWSVVCLCKLALRLSNKSAVDKTLSVLNSSSNTNIYHWFSGKTLGLNVLIGSNNYCLGIPNLSCGELVLYTDLAVRLNLNGKTFSCGGLLQGLLSHKGVRNTGWATSSSNDVIL